MLPTIQLDIINWNHSEEVSAILSHLTVFKYLVVKNIQWTDYYNTLILIVWDSEGKIAKDTEKK